MSKSYKRIEWEARIKDWKASGLSVARWCRENGHKDHQMYYWIQKIDGSPKKSKHKSPTVDFLPVKVTSELDANRKVLFLFISIKYPLRFNQALISIFYPKYSMCFNHDATQHRL